MPISKTGFQKLRFICRIVTGCLWLLLSGCLPATPYLTPTELVPTISHPSTATASVTSPTSTITPAPKVLTFQAFPVAEGETLALINARVIDGTGAPAKLDWTILIQGLRILAAGSNVEIPTGARIVNFAGQT